MPPEQAGILAEANAAGLDKLRSYLSSGEAVAFLGAGVSAPLYPLWGGVIAELIDVAAELGLGSEKATTCRAEASQRPDAVVQLLRDHLGVPRYRAALRTVFRVRRDSDTGRTWTPIQELICRCPFKAVVTTNYDPGIVDARMWIRPRASSTEFASWTDELALDRWRTGEVFDEQDLPVLFAHGHCNQPEAMVLATTEYRRAYAGKLSGLLARMMDAWHLVWIGFSFADQRIGGVLREVAEHTGVRVDPGGEPRHVAVMSWDPDQGRDPEILQRLAVIEYGADQILYPAPGGDHSALQRLLEEFVVDDYPPAPTVGQATQPAYEVAAATATSVTPSTRSVTREGSADQNWSEAQEERASASSNTALGDLRPRTKSGIFICYRRSGDAIGHAGRLYDRLALQFGAEHVFMDVDSIEPGLDFLQVITNALDSSGLMLVLIGRDWTVAKDSGSSARLDDPNDYVRIEIEWALERDIRIIPLLVEGARMPSAQDLPSSLESLARRNALDLRHASFNENARRLVEIARTLFDDAQG